MIADDFERVRCSLSTRATEDPEAEAALERIRRAFQRYLDAADRLTSLANRYAASFWAREVRQELGDAYLGGPLA